MLQNFYGYTASFNLKFYFTNTMLTIQVSRTWRTNAYYVIPLKSFEFQISHGFITHTQHCGLSPRCMDAAQYKDTWNERRNAPMLEPLPPRLKIRDSWTKLRSLRSHLRAFVSTTCVLNATAGSNHKKCELNFPIIVNRLLLPYIFKQTQQIPEKLIQTLRTWLWENS